MSVQDIRQALVGAGWSARVIDSALRSIEKPAKSKGRVYLLVLVGLISLLLIAVGAYFIFFPGDGIIRPSPDWKTYRSEEYGFEVRYPPKWILHISESDLPIIYIASSTLDFANAEALLIRPLGPSLDDLSIKNRTQAKVAGRNAVIIKDVSKSDTLIVQKLIMFKDSKDFSIALVRGLKRGQSTKNALVQLEVVLSTFRFISSPKTRESQTPTNDY